MSNGEVMRVGRREARDEEGGEGARIEGVRVWRREVRWEALREVRRDVGRE